MMKTSYSYTSWKHIARVNVIMTYDLCHGHHNNHKQVGSALPTTSHNVARGGNGLKMAKGTSDHFGLFISTAKSAGRKDKA